LKTCSMLVVEEPATGYWWECSDCYKQLRAPEVFDAVKNCPAENCPSCGAHIERWVGIDDD